MKLDFPRARKSEEPTLEKLVGAIELSDQDLAGVVGGDGGEHHRHEEEHHRHRHEEEHHRHHHGE